MRTLGAILTTALLLGAGPASGSHDAVPMPIGIARTLAPEALAATAPSRSAIRRHYPWRIPRATKDRPDPGGPRVHVVYVTTTDQPAPALDRLGIIEDSIRSQDGWMARQAKLRWRLDTFRFRVRGRRKPVRAVDVTLVASGRPGRDLDTLAEVRSLLEAVGLDDPERRYLAYVATDAGPVCGEGEFPLSDDPVQVGRYAAIYLYSDPGCGTGAFAPDRRTPSWAESVAQQELMHNDGAVPLAAPHDCRPTAVGHVCTPGLSMTDVDPEREDVMFPYASGPLSAKVLDRGRDDYFRHGLPYRGLEDSPYLVPAR